MKNVKIRKLRVEGIKATAAMDKRGRVLIAISDGLPLQWQVFYIFWSLVQYLKFKFLR